MTTAQLIEKLKALDPDGTAVVVKPGRDHSYYYVINAEATKASKYRDGRLDEYHGEEHVQDKENFEEAIPVIAIH